ncbi:MAG: methionyl aminopeptidase [Pirellulaceae bacterium]|jgi:methionyl aminopeptidase
MLRRKVILNETARDKMRAASQFNAKLIDHVRDFVKPGLTTLSIDEKVVEFTREHGHRAAPLNYHGFPKSCCTSVNEVICHGIPGDYLLKEGDIINVDVTSIVDGWYGDQSETFLIGEVSDVAKQVVQCAFDALYKAIDALEPNCTVSVIGRAIEEEAEKYNFGVVREYVGHGLGQKFHQDPSIPHYVTPESERERLAPGMCFTIEPMINVGTERTVLDKRDGWTVRTKDSLLSAQFEHTILMTEDRAEILTLTEHGPHKGHQFI